MADTPNTPDPSRPIPQVPPAPRRPRTDVTDSTPRSFPLPASPRAGGIFPSAGPQAGSTAAVDLLARSLGMDTAAALQRKLQQVEQLRTSYASMAAGVSRLLPAPGTVAALGLEVQRADQLAAVHATMMVNAILWVQPVVYLQKTLSPLTELISSELFTLVHHWAAASRSGPARRRYLARLALADLRRARRAARDGPVEEVDRFVAVYLGREIRAYLAEIRKVERGADRSRNYSRDEARSAVVTALLDPLLMADIDDEDSDPDVAIDGVRARLRRQIREFQPVWTHQHGGQRLLLLDADDRFERLSTEPDLLPGEYDDSRLYRARTKFSADEWTVLRTYGAGAGTWSDAAIAAGHTPSFGERVRRKAPRIGKEIERRGTLQPWRQ